MPEQKHLLGQLRYRCSDHELRAVFVNQVREHEKRTDRRFPSVELHRVVQLWLQRQGWKLQFEPTDIVINDVMVVHPDVDGDMVVRVRVESAEQWGCINDAGFRAGAPDDFGALHLMRKRRGGENCHVAVVVVNGDNGDMYVEVFTRVQMVVSHINGLTSSGQPTSSDTRHFFGAQHDYCE